jgi:methyl-accepting chemotaxis protein
MQDVTTMIDEIKTLSGRISARTDEQAQTIGRVASLASNLNTLASDVHSNIDTFDLEADLQTGAVGR